MADPGGEDELEELVDKYSLSHVLGVLGGICSEKADHIRASYEASEGEADAWDDAADVLSDAANEVDV
jgi:hypothetical protein